MREEKEAAAKEETRKKAAKETERVEKEKPREEPKKGNTQNEKREAKTVENTVIKADWKTEEKCGSGTINWTSSTGERSCVVGKVPQTVSIASSVVLAGDQRESARDENEVCCVEW